MVDFEKYIGARRQAAVLRGEGYGVKTDGGSFIERLMGVYSDGKDAGAR